MRRAYLAGARLWHAQFVGADVTDVRWEGRFLPKVPILPKASGMWQDYSDYR